MLRYIPIGIAGFVCFTGAVISAYLWYDKTRSILLPLTESLKREQLPIAQRYPAIESLILSKFSAPKLDAKAKEVLNSNVLEIDRAISSYSYESKGVDPSSRLKLEPDSADSLSQQYLATSDTTGVQVFVPAILLTTYPNESKVIETVRLRRILGRSPQLKTDVAVAFEVGDQLNRFKENAPSGKGWRPLQAYFITRTGLLAYPRSSNPPAVRSPTRVYFAQRPYFWETLGQKDFYATKPYFDLVGKGVVFTVCHALEPSIVSESIVCLDFGLEPNSPDRDMKM